MSSMHEGASRTLRDDGELVLSRLRRGGGTQLTLTPSAAHPAQRIVERLEREYALRDELDFAWAVHPIEFSQETGRPILTFEDPGGTLLSDVLRTPLDVADLLRVAIGIAAALRRAHERGIVHRDVKPAHVLWDAHAGQARLLGFGIASRLPRERRPLAPPRFIEGTLAYMSPEQTGRMNRSVDSRTDLYSLGVLLHEALTGELPFDASDATEWIHCHIAREPPSVCVRRSDAPAQVADIVSKLLEKPAERRYQTAAGLEADLRRCFEAWTAHGHIVSFPLASMDVPTTLFVPERLYGRDQDIDALLGAYERAARGEFEVVLVSGYSGIGKSSLVSELHKALIASRGFFAAGKFDPHQSDVPYAALAQAFASPVRHILAQSEEELARWRLDVAGALERTGGVVTDLLPELELVIGPQAALPELPPSEAQGRFRAAVKKFLVVLARREHPLVLFLDDLQWLDAATLTLLGWLVANRDGLSLLLIGAFRDNEVHAAHPLVPVLKAVRASGARVTEIRLVALSAEVVGELVADSLHGEQADTLTLAALIHEKTDGNPFFATEFLKDLVHENHVVFDRQRSVWTWDSPRIRAKRHTDNVVDLMAAKLTRLGPEALSLLREMACFGNAVLSSELSLIHGCTVAEVDSVLWEARRVGLVLAQSGASGPRDGARGGAYAFVHDRVQEAAYSQIPEGARRGLHLRIGRLLLSRLGDDAPDDVFRILNQLNRVVDLVEDAGERDALRRLNVTAGKKARAAVAYTNARDFLSTAAELASPDAWTSDYAETFDLYVTLAECEFLAGNFELADALFGGVLEHARSDVDRAAAHCVRLQLYQLAGQYERGLQRTIDVLHLFGVRLPESSSAIEAEIRNEYARVPLLLGQRPISHLKDAPQISDPSRAALVDLLVHAIPCAYIASPKLYPLITMRAVALSLEHGNTSVSCRAYATFAALLVSMFDDIPAAWEFSEMALQLNEKIGRARDRGSLLMVHAHRVYPWKNAFSAAVPVQDHAFATCLEVGDLAYASYVAALNAWRGFEKGDTLDNAIARSHPYAAFAKRVGNHAVHALIQLQGQFFASLQGRTDDALGMTDASFDEAANVAVLEKATFGSGLAFYFIMKEVLAVLDGRYSEVLDWAAACEPLLPTITALAVEATHHLHHGLALAALATSEGPDRRHELARLLAHKARRFAAWAAHCPENFGARSALLTAEVARVEERDLDAMRAYEEAIRLARAHERGHDEALALETAARFYEARGLESAASGHFRDARDAFGRWGAHEQVRRLERQRPHLREREQSVASLSTIGADVDDLDLVTVIRTMQALTSEIALDKWTAQVLTIALEDAGARRGVLLVRSDGELSSFAEAKATASGVEVRMLDTPAALPGVLLRYVERTREAVVLDDASLPNDFSSDPYLAGSGSRSILCLPLAKQGALRGALYLENDLTPGAFTRKRTALLKLLASQAALSLENVWLHADVQRENDSRRRTEAALRLSEMFLAQAQHGAHIGSWLFKATGFESWSPELFRIYGRDPERGPPPTEEYLALVHVEDRPFVARLIRNMADQISFDFIKRVVRSDGTTRWVRCVGAPAIHEGKSHGYVGTDIDVTEQHEAQAALQAAQAELARVMRVTAVGELAASITHEVRQPLAAIAADSAAAVNWLRFDPPRIEPANEALSAISAACQRAGDVLARISAMLKRETLERTTCDLNAIVSATVPLVRSLLERKGVALATDLAAEVPAVLGDPVQLQQVLINLLLNAGDACGAVEEERRRVVIRTLVEQRNGQMWSVASVADTGRGIAPDATARLFEPFYTTKSEGLGMGLSISRSIVRSHEGELTVAPNMPHGAQFTIGLPSSP